MNTIRAKIEARLDALEHALLRQDHLVEDSVAVLEILASVSKFYSALSEEQRDFIQAARWAISEKKEWAIVQ
ncbi:MAG: hypothetical protein EBT07_11625 [Actinobacteria bacterium]|nr:hypothetical protein [Actinomycetota bacterium]